VSVIKILLVVNEFHFLLLEKVVDDFRKRIRKRKSGHDGYLKESWEEIKPP